MSSKWTDRVQRLRSMSAEELRERGLQEVHKRLDLLRFHARVDRGKVSLRPAASDSAFFFYPDQLPEIIKLLRRLLPDDVSAIVAGAEKICAHRFDLLGHENLDFGAGIDWHLDPVHRTRAPLKPWHKIPYLDFSEVGDAKITWELNRHQHLVTLAKAFLLTEDARFAEELFAQWYDWREHNPYPVGINWASSLEVAFRSLSWLWVKRLLAGSSVVPPTFERDLLHMLAIHGRHIQRYLSTFFSPNTHLLGEGVALFFIGTLCPELPRAKKWQQLGWKIVLQESERQVRADGLHFEQSTYYHVYALDFFLHSMLLASRNHIEIPESLERKVEQMLDVLCVLGRSGTTFRFGDDDGGRLFDPRRNRAEHLADPLATGAVLFDRSDFKAAAGTLREETVWLLGPEGVARFNHLAAAAVTPSSAAFEESGLYLMTSGGNNAAQVLIDAGPFGAHTAGHGHADALSIQMAQAGKLLLVDPGTAEYIGPGSHRAVFRGTSAHNTLTVDHRSQALPKGPFSWNSLPATDVDLWIQSESFDLFCGSHRGYAAPPSPVTHRRWVFHHKPDLWFVRDCALGSGRHHLAVHWHLAPGMVPHNSDRKLFLVPSSESGLALITAPESNWRMELKPGEWSPVYGKIEPAPVVRFECEAQLPAELATLVTPASTAAELGNLVPLRHTGQSSVAIGYAYSTRQQTHTFLFSTSAATWSLGDWSSDAEFVYCRAGQIGFEEIIFCNGTHVSFKGRRVASSRNRIRSCEMKPSRKTLVQPENEAVVLHQWPQIHGHSGVSPEPAHAEIG
jgi:hypothetical protein